MGYKAGMTHVFLIDNEPRSSTYGKEIMCPATVIDAPPILICAVRAYTKDEYGLKTFTEAWMEDPPKEVERAFTLPKSLKLRKI